ncbi:MAG: pyridoxamine 5'-phosphate oxidase [Planctomycetota bacterium]
MTQDPAANASDRHSESSSHAVPEDVGSAYAIEELLPDPLPAAPFALFQAWFDDAHARRQQPNPNAMTLATADEDGNPNARIVLCKEIRAEPGVVLFYTNYDGTKARELRQNARATLVFHWDHADRQVRISGPVTRATAAESDAYFKTRAWQSRLGAWSSRQSQPIESREVLLEQVMEKAIELGLDITALVDQTAKPGDFDIPRPPNWGGFRVWAARVELWCGGTGRVHDRAAWTRNLMPNNDGFTADDWACTRLQP